MNKLVTAFKRSGSRVSTDTAIGSRSLWLATIIVMGLAIPTSASAEPVLFQAGIRGDCHTFEQCAAAEEDWAKLPGHYCDGGSFQIRSDSVGPVPTSGSVSPNTAQLWLIRIVPMCYFPGSEHPNVYQVDFFGIGRVADVCPGGQAYVFNPVDDLVGCVEPEDLFALVPEPQPANCSSNRTNPCNPADGNKSQRETDIERAASGVPGFSRYFNSQGPYKTAPGMPAGWRHTYSRSIDEQPDRQPSILVGVASSQSSFYGSASNACTMGWGDIKATLWSGVLAAGVASYDGGSSCTISVGGSTAARIPVRSAGRRAVYSPPANIKTVSRPNGVSHKFELVGSDWTNELSPSLRLEALGSNWIFTNSDDSQETYDASGKLQTITYRNGQTETLEYDLTVAEGGDDNTETLDRVTGPFGHTLALAYDGNGRISTVTSPDGAIQYAFDGANNLASVTYPGNLIRQYVYEDVDFPNHLTGIIDANNDRFATWAYDDTGRAILSEHAGGKEQVQLAYNTDGTTTLTMANGAVQTFTFILAQGQQRVSALSGDVCSTCPGGNIKNRGYDSNGFLAETTDWNDTVTKTARSARGLVETLTEAYGDIEQRVTTTQWHADYRLPTTVTSPQNVTDLTYDANGNVLSLTVSGGGKSRVWGFTYDANGQPLTIDGPRTDVTDITTLSYYNCATGNECGQLAYVSNALGHVTTFDAYDGAGRVTQMTEPNGLMTALVYDGRGQVTTITETPSAGPARVTSMTYDGVGQLATYTLPNGVTLTYAYDDAHYLTSITDSLGNYTNYSYDAMGGQTGEQSYDPNDNLRHAIAYTNDINYRLDTIESGGFTTDMTLDLVGNLISETEPGGAVNQYVYDALNRLQSTTDALTGVIEFNYDNHDNLTEVVAPNGATTDYVYDALGNLVSESSPDRGITSYTHDDAGNRLTSTDARGITAIYAYDALNRLTSVSYPDSSENILYSYDDGASNGTGRLRSITDQSGVITFAYDEFGNIVTDQRTIASVSYTTTYQYDGANNISAMTYPSGRTVTYARDAAGQVTQVTSTKNSIAKTIISAATYEPFGPLSSLLYGNGVGFVYDYGLDYRINSITSTGIADKQYSYDMAANIGSIDDSLDTSRSAIFDYDVLDRITTSTIISATGGSYADMVMADAPLAYWRLGEASGTVAFDSSGNGHDANFGGTVTLGQPSLTGDNDTSMRIASQGSGYASTPTLTGITVTGMEAWFQTDSYSNYRDVMSLNNLQSDRLIVIQYTDGKVRLYRNNGPVMVSDAVVTSGEPHHIAAWYEAGSNTTYMMIDGVTQQSTYSGNLLAVNNPRVYFAAFEHRGNPYRRYLGYVDEVAIYDGAVSASTFGNRAGSPSADYTYDANGNRASHHDGSALQTLSYQPQSNTLNSIDGAAIQHDAAGNRTADLNGTRTFGYSDANRLDEVSINGSSIATYGHNALGQRARKAANSADIVYIYDLAGNLIAEHSSTGTLVRDYVWLSGAPIGQIDQGEVFSYLHFDHLGTPRLATNDSQAVVWRWESDAFGAALPDDEPDGDGNSTAVNLRFPGQYYDAETGFHYNYYRTYDPSTGRYLESDPIGLAAGPNTYSYVSNMPTMHVDPFGLIKWKGDFEIAALSGGVGVAQVVFNLESECVAGQMVKIEDWKFWAFQTDFGLPFGAIKGSVSLEDRLSSLSSENLNHQNLEGDFNANGIGPTIGPFGLPTSINLGKGTGLGRGKGFDPSLLSGASAGDLKIPREKVRYLECECE